MKPRGDGKPGPAGRQADESEAASSAPRGRRQLQDSRQLREVFEQFDENKDGEISREEMGRALRRLGLAPASDRELSDIISHADDNRDGVVDFAEFSHLYRSIMHKDGGRHSRRLHSTGSNNNDDDDDRLDNEEDDDDDDDDDESLREAFRVFDQDGDGFIRAEELHSVLSAMGILHGRTLSDCRTMISSFDSDGNGRVDFQEFKKMMAHGGST